MLKGKTKHRTEEHHPVIAAVGLHSQRQMIDTEIVLAHRHAITQMKIALVDSLPGVDEIDKAAVGGADRRDRRFVRPGVALPVAYPSARARATSDALCSTRSAIAQSDTPWR